MDFSQMSPDALAAFIQDVTPEQRQSVFNKARELCDAAYGRRVYLRGLIEISNHCAKDCYYCGIRRGNKSVERYRLDKRQILDCCALGDRLGLKTFVLQGGEDAYFTDERLVDIVSSIKAEYPDHAITLSLGERSEQSYILLKKAGADRYLLRHETADQEHYSRLHPADSVFENRMQCIRTLKSLSFQTGVGFMVGSPRQTALHLAQDLLFVNELQPQMIGIGPFIPHADTPFANHPAGALDRTLLMVALARIFCPNALIPATTALSALDENNGRIGALHAGANVVMPNLTPPDFRSRYTLYNQKDRAYFESAELLQQLKQMIIDAGFQPDMSRGDYCAVN